MNPDEVVFSEENKQFDFDEKEIDDMIIERDKNVNFLFEYFNGIGVVTRTKKVVLKFIFKELAICMLDGFLRFDEAKKCFVMKLQFPVKRKILNSNEEIISATEVDLSETYNVKATTNGLSVLTKAIPTFGELEDEYKSSMLGAWLSVKDSMKMIDFTGVESKDIQRLYLWSKIFF